MVGLAIRMLALPGCHVPSSKAAKMGQWKETTEGEMNKYLPARVGDLTASLADYKTTSQLGVGDLQT